MQIDVVQVDRREAGMVSVTVNVTLRGKSPEVVTVRMPEPTTYVQNFAGWYQDVDGKWHRPWKLEGEVWKFHLDPLVKWKKQPATDEEIAATLSYKLPDFWHQEIVEYCQEVGFPEYVDAESKVRVVPQSQVHIDSDTGMVRVDIEAFDSETEESLWVDDGIWTFAYLDPNVGSEFDPATRLRRELARRVREMQP